MREQTFRLRSNLDFVALLERLRCEHGPAVTDVTGILADVDKDLEDCEAEVGRLQSRIIALHNQHRLLEQYRTYLRSFRSPIRRLPNETVLRIFEYACGMNELTSKKLGDMPTLVISSVCSRWRSLVKTRPALWSFIRINMQLIPPNEFLILGLYLESSRQSPLCIELIGKPKTLELHHQTCGAGSRFRVLSTRSRTLQECSASVYIRVLPSQDLGEIQFPWKQLRLLSLERHPSGMKNVLHICDKLTELQFREVDAGPGSYELSSPPATASVLETLSLSVSQTSLSESLAEVVFSSMSCPSLTSLLLEARNEYRRAWPKEALHTFISRSSFHLTTLSIKFIALSDADLIDLLHRLPSLLHLTIDDSKQSLATTATTPSPITSRLIHSLHAFPHTKSASVSSALVRRLQTLDVTFSGSTAFDDGEFIEMVSSRWLPADSDAFGLQVHTANHLDSGIGTECLRSVVMRFRNRGVNDKVYSPSRHLEQAGMRVVIVDKSPES
ncbi:hypothetical protein BT96DRAFT_1026274 [Gymnopus androsaceus JB14]|uniref:F-box domain-containing protein n=1 Tax=Gymnopus androsaceus JB14 TaxID=1447944 RepID=A0A6A4GKZ8_9AGAR|nr:hypothetical protein BT96DRAFT_1026274 [Gymnopus androsaceus JB14]